LALAYSKDQADLTHRPTSNKGACGGVDWYFFPNGVAQDHQGQAAEKRHSKQKGLKNLACVVQRRTKGDGSDFDRILIVSES